MLMAANVVRRLREAVKVRAYGLKKTGLKGVEEFEYHMRQLFNRLDSDGSGTVDPNEFRVGLKRLMPSLFEDEFALLWNLIDEDGGGEISYEEFIDFVRDAHEHGERLEKDDANGADDGAVLLDGSAAGVRRDTATTLASDDGSTYNIYGDQSGSQSGAQGRAAFPSAAALLSFAAPPPPPPPPPALSSSQQQQQEQQEQPTAYGDHHRQVAHALVTRLKARFGGQVEGGGMDELFKRLDLDGGGVDADDLRQVRRI